MFIKGKRFLRSRKSDKGLQQNICKVSLKVWFRASLNKLFDSYDNISIFTLVETTLCYGSKRSETAFLHSSLVLWSLLWAAASSMARTKLYCMQPDFEKFLESTDVLLFAHSQQTMLKSKYANSHLPAIKTNLKKVPCLFNQWSHFICCCLLVYLYCSLFFKHSCCTWMYEAFQ